MSVRDDDVRAVAELARLGVPAGRLPALARELGSILEHMEVLSGVEIPPTLGEPAPEDGMPLRPDVGPQEALANGLDAFAPEVRDGFFVVRRLDSHDDAGSAA